MPSRLRGPPARTNSNPYQGPHSPGPKPKRLSDAMQRSTSPDTVGRGSFSSVREHDSDLAQSFTSTKISSYAEAYEEAVDDSSDVQMAGVEYLPPLTKPASKLHGLWYPAGTFSRGWKEIPVKGRHASKSYSDLQALHRFTALSQFDPTLDTPEETPNAQKGGIGAPGTSMLERLPVEILSKLPHRSTDGDIHPRRNTNYAP
jgi:hypothetical protein